MKASLIIILVAVSSLAFAQQEQRKVKSVNAAEHITTTEKGSGQTRSTQPQSYDKVVPSTSGANPADTKKWNELPQRKVKPANATNKETVK